MGTILINNLPATSPGRVLFAPVAGGVAPAALSALASPSDQPYGWAGADFADVLVSPDTNVVTIVASGGSGGYTYAWAFESGFALTMYNLNNTAHWGTSGLTPTDPIIVQYVGVYKCTVTDSSLASVVVHVTATCEIQNYGA